jgi:hypothetical protein
MLSVVLLSFAIKPHKINGVMLSVIMLNVIMLSVIMLNVIMLNVIMLNVIMLSVIMLNVIMLSGIMLSGIMLSGIMLNVIMQNIIMLIAWCHYAECRGTVIYAELIFLDYQTLISSLMFCSSLLVVTNISGKFRLPISEANFKLS